MENTIVKRSTHNQNEIRNKKREIFVNNSFEVFQIEIYVIKKAFNNRK